MKKLVFIFIALFVLVVVTGCNSRNDTVRFNTEINEEPAGESMEAETMEEEEEMEMKMDETTMEEADKMLEDAMTMEMEKGSGEVTVKGAVNGSINTKKNYNVITGTVPTGTKTVKVNDYTLRQFQAGQSDWSYIAATGLGTLEEGSNPFIVSALDAGGNEIGSESFMVYYELPAIPHLPGVGAGNLALMILLSMAGGAFFSFRKRIA